MRIAAHGLVVEPPAGWDVQIYRRTPGPGEQTYPILHAGNFPLPKHRGDFGAGAVELMDHGHVFVALVEHDEDAASSALFAREGFPQPRAEEFSPRQLQRPLLGQGGVQYFFSSAGRAFCLYVVLGSHGRRRRMIESVNGFLRSVSVA